MAKKFLGAIVYRGPSMIDGSPIVAIATGFNGSDNPKTGANLVQVFILRADIDPTVAVNSGEDAAICGTCPHRGAHDSAGNLIPSTRSCYVVTFRAPRVVFSAYQRGIYTDMTQAGPGAIGQIFNARFVRLGAYGDPAAVPFHVWQSIMARAAGGTGYTHAWRNNPELAQYCMASCDTESDRVQAQALGFRTFRVAPKGAQPAAREVLCPASEEAGKKTTCSLCKACGGHASKAKADIMIPLHGIMAGAATRRGVVA